MHAAIQTLLGMVLSERSRESIAGASSFHIHNSPEGFSLPVPNRLGRKQMGGWAQDRRTRSEGCTSDVRCRHVQLVLSPHPQNTQHSLSRSTRQGLPTPRDTVTGLIALSPKREFWLLERGHEGAHRDSRPSTVDDRWAMFNRSMHVCTDMGTPVADLACGSVGSHGPQKGFYIT